MNLTKSCETCVVPQRFSFMETPNKNDCFYFFHLLLKSLINTQLESMTHTKTSVCEDLTLYKVFATLWKTTLQKKPTEKWYKCYTFEDICPKPRDISTQMDCNMPKQFKWDGDIYFSHCTWLSKGVAILIPSQLKDKFEILNIQIDDEGRILILDCAFDKNLILLVNVYAPTKDHIDQQLTFVKQLKELLEQFGGKIWLLGEILTHALTKIWIKKVGNQKAIQNNTIFKQYHGGILPYWYLPTWKSQWIKIYKKGK